MAIHKQTAQIWEGGVSTSALNLHGPEDNSHLSWSIKKKKKKQIAWTASRLRWGARALKDLALRALTRAPWSCSALTLMEARFVQVQPYLPPCENIQHEIYLFKYSIYWNILHDTMLKQKDVSLEHIKYVCVQIFMMCTVILVQMNWWGSLFTRPVKS